MTYKKFVEQAVELSATKWIGQLAGEDWHVYPHEVRLERDKDSITYDVDVELVKNGEPWIRKEYTVGGAIGESVGICNSVVWGDTDKYGIRAIAWADSEFIRNLEGITTDHFGP
jgi:hypothetical protein